MKYPSKSKLKTGEIKIENNSNPFNRKNFTNFKKELINKNDQFENGKIPV